MAYWKILNFGILERKIKYLRGKCELEKEHRILYNIYADNWNG
jgi:hypothetical protein